MFREKMVGLALSGGSARGMAHIGVLEVLQKEGIPVDIIAGASIGSLIGAVYAQEKDASDLKEQALEISRKRITSLLDLTFPRSGFVEGKKITDMLKRFVGGDVLFSDLKIPLAVVATDINTGKEVVIKDGSVLDAVRGSISLPVIFSVARWRDRYLVDGGLVNPVPVNVAREMGAEYVIAVNVIPEVAERIHGSIDPKTGKQKAPGLIGVITQTIYVSTYALTSICLKDADIVIRPRVGHIGFYDLHNAAECIRAGEVAAQDAIPEIRKRLGLRRRSG